MTTAADDLSLDNLRRLIATMREWSMSRPWTPAQTAAWRLRWFGVTPEQDARRLEEYRERRMSELARGFDRYDSHPGYFNDWPNGQGE